MSGRVQPSPRLETVLERQRSLTVGTYVYSGLFDRIMYRQVDHTNHIETTERLYLGSGYTFLDGSPAYTERVNPSCCYYTGEHKYIPVSLNEGEFLGLICRHCLIFDPNLTQETVDGYRDVSFGEGKGRT